MEVQVFVDGSYSCGSTSTPQGGIGILILGDASKDISISVLDEPKYPMDNQIIEALAIYIGLYITQDIPDVTIYSDCQHSVMCLTEWYNMFELNGWMTTKKKRVAHADTLIQCANIREERNKLGYITTIEKVKAHSCITGNDVADAYAKKGMRGGGDFFMTLPTNVYNYVVNHVELNELQKSMGTRIQLTNMCPKKSKASTTEKQTEPSPAILPTTTPLPVAQWLNTMEKHFNKSNDSTNITEKKPISEIKEIDADNCNLFASDNEKEYEAHIDTRPLSPTIIEFGKYLICQCLHCSESICIRYPVNKCSNLFSILNIHDECVILLTSCADCLTMFGKRTGTNGKTKADKLTESINQSYMSASIFKKLEIYDCAREITDRIPAIVEKSGYIKYVSIYDITNKCTSECNVSSIDVSAKKILPYLKLKFLV